METATITIDKDISLPPIGKAGSKSKYPWVTMAVGESFFVSGVTLARFSPQVVNSQKRFKTKYTCRSVDGGVRVWRLK
jgi:hypothetical protein